MGYFWCATLFRGIAQKNVISPAMLLLTVLQLYALPFCYSTPPHWVNDYKCHQQCFLHTPRLCRDTSTSSTVKNCFNLKYLNKSVAKKMQSQLNDWNEFICLKKYCSFLNIKMFAQGSPAAMRYPPIMIGVAKRSPKRFSPDWERKISIFDNLEATELEIITPWSIDNEFNTRSLRYWLLLISIGYEIIHKSIQRLQDVQYQMRCLFY